MAGTALAAQCLAQFRYVNQSLCFHPLGINFFNTGRVENLHALGKQLFLVGDQRARIGIEVFGRAKLQRINENTDNDNVAQLAGFTYQVEVTLVQISHRGDKCDALAIATNDLQRGM